MTRTHQVRRLRQPPTKSPCVAHLGSLAGTPRPRELERPGRSGKERRWDPSGWPGPRWGRPGRSSGGSAISAAVQSVASGRGLARGRRKRPPKARRRAGPGIPQRATRSSGLQRSPALRGPEDHQGPAHRLGNVFGRRYPAARESQGQGRGGAQAQGGLRAALEDERKVTERKVTGRMVDWAAAHTRATTEGGTREWQSRAVHPTDEPSRGTPR